jgi:hypothetical protein
VTQPAPLWNDALPPGSPPFPAAPFRPDKRYVTCGTTCLVLAAADLLYSLQKVIGSLLSGPLIEFEKALLASGKHPVAMPGVLDAASDFLARIALWETLRVVPFVIASGVLLWIGARIRRGDPRGVRAARTWVWWALGVVLVSALIQLLVTVPATMAYQRQIVAALPVVPAGASPPPFDIKRLMSTFTIAFSALGLITGTAVMATWPIVLHVWAGRLLRDLPTAISAGEKIG